MNRKLISFLLAGMIIISATSCYSGRENDVSSVPTELTELTEESVPTAVVLPMPVTPTPSPMPASAGKADYVPVSGQDYVIPYMYQRSFYTSNMEDRFADILYGLVNQDGEIVCEGIFDYIYPVEDAGLYAVRKKDSNGDTKFGLLSLDGSKYTGAVYDSCSAFGGTYRGDPGLIYMTNNDSTTMSITCYDYELNTLWEDREIAVDPTRTAYSSINPTYCEMLFDNDRAIVAVSNFDAGLTSKYLIDTNTGECLQALSWYERVIIFDDMMLLVSDNCSFIDFNGERMFADEYERIFLLSDDRIVLTGNGKVDVMDADGQIFTSLDIPEDSFVDFSSENILICYDGNTYVYNGDLELINTIEGLDISYGMIPDNRDRSMDDAFFFSYDTCNYLTDLNTGVSVRGRYDYDYYMQYGYLIGNNNRNDNVTSHSWMIMDTDLNTVYEGDGIVAFYEDMVTDDIYIVASEADVTTVYNLTDAGEVVTELDYSISDHRIQFTDGIMSFRTDNTEHVISPDGTELFTWEIET